MRSNISARPVFSLTASLVLVAAVTLAAKSPVAVSPGSASGERITTPCPTFSWGGSVEVDRYEVLVYRVLAAAEDVEPVVRQEVPGSALAWTPSLGNCLQRGAAYAWQVRAITADEAGGWSAPHLFEVTPMPTHAELKEALEVVHRYLEAQGRRVASEGSRRAVSTGSAPAESRRQASATSSPGVAGVPPPGGDGALQVNGSPVITLATFRGAQCQAMGLRYLDLGDGTVLDCNTGLIWLRDASCEELAGTDVDGSGGWNTALLAAEALENGECGLSDGSETGDWRLPTPGELCSRDEPVVIGGVCPVAEASTSLFDTSLTEQPLVVNSTGNVPWSEGDPFVEIPTAAFYWTNQAFDVDKAYFGSVFSGTIDSIDKDSVLYIWPVKEGM